MADRIVDEMNPDAHLSSKEVHSLICDEEDDPPPLQMDTDHISTFEEPVMKALLARHGSRLTKAPFAHESLLVDRKDSKLSRAEKKLAQRSYTLERTSKITYSRPSYAAFYPKAGCGPSLLHNPGSRGHTRNRYYEHGKRLDTWLPAAAHRPPEPAAPAAPPEAALHVDMSFPTPDFSNVLAPPPPNTEPISSTSDWGPRRNDWSKPVKPPVASNKDLCTSASGMSTSSALNALKQQGVGLQQVVVPRDLVIPTGHNSSVSLVAGQSVMVIKTPKGIYLRIDEKIIKIKQPAAVQGLLGMTGPSREDDWVSPSSSLSSE